MGGQSVSVAAASAVTGRGWTLMSEACSFARSSVKSIWNWPEMVNTAARSVGPSDASRYFVAAMRACMASWMFRWASSNNSATKREGGTNPDAAGAGGFPAAGAELSAAAAGVAGGGGHPGKNWEGLGGR